ncbi:MAG: hypothetical protein KatS3mg105_4535 [Gemmatales bacterium]|nr:MAG: hypothetical protein KatS3mg105_4535 [Gemmatales bacterium]
MAYFLLFLFGIAVGIASGLLGIGGGIVLVPGLVYLFQFTQKEAQGTSLAVLSLPVLLFAAVVYYKRGFVHLPSAGWVALGFVVGAYIGASLVVHVPVHVLRTLFGLVLLYLGFMMIMTTRRPTPRQALTSGVAALVAALIGLVARRRSAKAPVVLESSEDDIEYHI